jgi:L-aminopeptidase/D-esterase-like protein
VQNRAVTPSVSLRDVPGLQVGHATDAERRTGCTVVLATSGAVAGVDVRGSAPGTRETDLLRPTALVERVHAICLSGGSAFGLAAADGVMSWLAERGIGVETGARPVPIVPAAVIFDLFVGDPVAAPGPSDGAAACDAAEAGEGELEGCVGAGTGATVGKMAGPHRASPSGVGSAGRRLEDGTIVAALAVTNAFGNVVVPDGRILAGVHAEGWASGEEEYVSAEDVLGKAPAEVARFGGNTTLAVIGTDAALDRAGCQKLAQLGHDALAIAIRPVHTMLDGDTVFALSTGAGESIRGLDLVRLGTVAVDALVEAIQRSVLTARASRGMNPGASGASWRRD